MTVLLILLALGRWVQVRLGWHGLLIAVLWQVTLMWWGLLVLWALPLPLQSAWFRVRAWEAPLYRQLRVRAFMLLLRAVGWERARRRARGFTGSRASLLRLERQTREAEFSHVLLVLVNLTLPVLTGMTGDTAGWLIVTGAAGHVYPVMLQRTLRARLQQLDVTGNRSHHGRATD
ncbi:glycosyl-4,4'-diaponeurosporenoate acyltransferase CrtO family protein [Deinococcus sedimenti]|uniref:Glycosyl-4,4'-diaponeurosporenoate acyltransferase n=1 Tax=Deinococcus sedimenti TaxID=1867090 RepID=A0ABQ2S3B1_9DEIO|nr:hypothetical protein [Deinococcus sedimenti]GGR93374.1 hypothetical protein GCM10008960_20460 [Deinococcus sedimenti]